MFKLYVIQNLISSTVYFGITRKTLKVRFNGHKSLAKRKPESNKLTRAISKYGIENFQITLLKEFSTINECHKAEIDIIQSYKDKGTTTYNLAKGGEGGYSVPEHKRDAWINKLKDSRKGRTPAKGMRHTSENKKLFSKVSKEYWNSVQTYPIEVTDLPLSLAIKNYGISKTHYYRLKRTKANDLS